jgi:TRAP-type transport system periplasmic protein
MKKSIIALLAGPILAGLLLAPTVATSQEFTLRLHTFVPPIANPFKHFLKPWADKIAKDSKGRIKVQLFPAMQLGGKPTQLLDQVRDGVVDIVWVLPGFTPGRMPKIETFELPFVHRDVHSTVLAMQDFQKKYLQDELKDYKVLLIHATEGFLFMTKRPITKLEDFKGMKLRGASRTGVWTLEALGAAAIGTPLPQLPPMLAKGTVDGSLLPYEIAPAVKMQELVNYFTVLSPPQQRLGTVVFTFLMNKNSYNKLPTDLKKVIDDNSGQNLVPTAIKAWQDIELRGEAVMHAKKKNHFNTLSPKETARVKAASKPVYDRFFAEMKKLGFDGEQMLADAHAMIEKYAK